MYFSGKLANQSLLSFIFQFSTENFARRLVPLKLPSKHSQLWNSQSASALNPFADILFLSLFERGNLSKYSVTCDFLKIWIILSRKLMTKSFSITRLNSPSAKKRPNSVKFFYYEVEIICQFGILLEKLYSIKKTVCLIKLDAKIPKILVSVLETACESYDLSHVTGKMRKKISRVLNHRLRAPKLTSVFEIWDLDFRYQVVELYKMKTVFSKKCPIYK